MTKKKKDKFDLEEEILLEDTDELELDVECYDEDEEEEETSQPNPLEKLTLFTIIRDAITEHAESRTERYEVYKNRDKGEYKPKFLNVCYTYAYLAQIRRPDALIRLEDKYGEVRNLNAQAYHVPDFLYDMINYSGRVYFCDEDNHNENYLTEATRKASDLEQSKLLKRLLSPEDVNAFWKDYNANNSEKTNLIPLTKTALPITALAGIMVKDDNASAGYVFKKWNSSGSTVSATTLQARLVTCDELKRTGSETQVYSISVLIHRVASSKNTGVDNKKEDENK